MDRYQRDPSRLKSEGRGLGWFKLKYDISLDLHLTLKIMIIIILTQFDHPHPHTSSHHYTFFPPFPLSSLDSSLGLDSSIDQGSCLCLGRVGIHTYVPLLRPSTHVIGSKIILARDEDRTEAEMGLDRMDRWTRESDDHPSNSIGSVLEGGRVTRRSS